MKQKILKWLNNIEAQSKKLKKRIKEEKKQKSSDKFFKSNRRIAKIDDGILSATIDTQNKDVIITIKGFDTISKAVNWATLQSILWQTDQDARDYLSKETIKPRLH